MCHCFILISNNIPFDFNIFLLHLQCCYFVMILFILRVSSSALLHIVTDAWVALVILASVQVEKDRHQKINHALAYLNRNGKLEKIKNIALLI